jgi:hypothetical protein
LLCLDCARGVADACGADQTADDYKRAGDADAGAESVERGLARCVCDCHGLVWR